VEERVNARPHPAKGILAVRRISNRQIAAQYNGGTSAHFIGRVLNGYIRPPSAFRAWLAGYLDVPAAELFHNEPSADSSTAA
jgi:hypothetical protein